MEMLFAEFTTPMILLLNRIVTLQSQQNVVPIKQIISLYFALAFSIPSA
jgi:hypothetical protein